MRSKLFFIIIILFHVSVWSQKTSNSPFSSYGLGEFGGFDHASFSAFGNISVPLSDSLNLNFNNPASYSFLGIGQPIFSTGISAKFSTFNQNGTTEKNNISAVNHFALGVPFAKRFGIGMGLKPFTRKGYDFSEKLPIGTDSIVNNYRGNGSTNQVFGGLSIKIINIKKHKLSIGLNLSYIFGRVNDERLANLSSQTFGAIEQKSYQIKSLSYELGLSYIFNISPNQALNIGLTYLPEQHLTTFKNTILASASDISNEQTYTSLGNVYEKGEILFPSIISSGVSYTYRPKVDSSYNKTKIPQIKFLGEFSSANWASYASTFVSDSAYNYQNTTKIAFGVEFTPHYNYLDRSKAITYFHKIKYRAGLQYASLPIVRNGVALKSQLYSVGFSLPIISQRSVSSFNVGLTFGEKGKGTSFSEKFVGLNVGVNIAPGTYDRWFRKYKID